MPRCSAARSTREDSSTTRIHAFDNWNRDKWDWCRKLETDAELRDSIDILSNHTLSCVYENNGPTPDWVQALADRLHKPIWDTEEHVYLDGYKCELMLVKSLNGNFLDAGAARTVNWYLVDAMYSVEPFKIKPGMLVADSPWSGHYAVREALWGYAHYGQFSKIGWQYLPKACGRLAGGGTYVTLKSPETDYSVILETGDAKARQTVTFRAGRRRIDRQVVCLAQQQPRAVRAAARPRTRGWNVPVHRRPRLDLLTLNDHRPTEGIVCRYSGRSSVPITVSRTVRRLYARQRLGLSAALYALHLRRSSTCAETRWKRSVSPANHRPSRVELGSGVECLHNPR